jgi:hypothetical protein
MGSVEIGTLGACREGSAGRGPGGTPPLDGGRDGGLGDGTIGGDENARAPGGCGCRIAGGDVVGGATGNGTGTGGVGAGAGFGSATGTGGVGAGADSGGRSLLQNGHRTAMAGICSAQKKQFLVVSMILCQRKTLARARPRQRAQFETPGCRPRHPE